MSEHLGLKIKRLREEAKISIEQLAELAGIRISQLELIERVEQIPSMATIIKLARVLQVRPGTILDGEEHSGPALSTIADQKAAIRISNDNTEARKHLRYFSLAQKKADRNMDPLIVEVGYADPLAASLTNHEGEEFIYVLEGDIELRYGSETYPLLANESVYYDSLVPHCLSTPNKDAQKAKIIKVTYIPY